MTAGETELNEQARISMIESANCAKEEVGYSVRNECSPEVRERVQAMQWIISAPDRSTYLERQRQIAKQFNLTIRQVQRLIKLWETSGITGLERKGRSDCGKRRLAEDWTDYIVQTYRAGNRGGRRMSRAQVAVRVAARALEIGDSNPPSRISVYRVLQREIDQQAVKSHRRSIGWQGETIILKTREGLAVEVKESNQVWQCDHTRVDLMVVDQVGEVLGRPWLTTIVDTHSRCIMGIHLGMEAPSAVVVCLALRHAILPKQYSSAYELTQLWRTYGVPQYFYTDGGKEFNSKHLEQVANELKIVLCQRRYPAEGGIVERPFGTLNTELFATLPGYTGNSTKRRPQQAETSASLTLVQLEKQIVRYIVDRYNQNLDARMGNQSRIGRWETAQLAQLPLLSERELDICLMRQERRRVYRSGYVQFANLSYQGEHLAGYAGEEVVLRYNPRDITTVLVYQQQGNQDVFLARAHAIGLETESLSLAEAQAISRRVRAAGKLVTNQSVLTEVQDRDRRINQMHQQKPKKQKQTAPELQLDEVQSEPFQNLPPCDPAMAEPGLDATERSDPEAIEVPEVRVWDYEELKRNYGKWW